MARFGAAISILVVLASNAGAFTPLKAPVVSRTRLMSTTEEVNKNVAQTESTSREEVMTFSYDMSLEPKYEKPTYPGTGNGLSGDSGEYDVVVIGSGMGGLACGALCAKYGQRGTRSRIMIFLASVIGVSPFATNILWKLHFFFGCPQCT